MKNMLKTSLLAAAIAVAGSITQAATLLLGGTSSVTGTTAAADPELPGTVENDDILTSFLRIPDPGSPFGVGFDIQNRVIESDTTGTLNFGPRILFGANITVGNFLIDSLQLYGYGDFETDVAYRTDGLGDRGPTFAERSADGEMLNFGFGFPLVVGNLVQSIKEESYFLSIKTNATHFENTGRASILGRHIAHPGQTFRLDYSGLAVPALAPVPLPASVLFLLGGLGALFGLRRRSSNATSA